MSVIPEPMQMSDLVGVHLKVETRIMTLGGPHQLTEFGALRGGSRIRIEPRQHGENSLGFTGRVLAGLA
ncbi:hypothetical protein [Rhizobium leguminosarum]|uniref:hypothetical protein n=1 Tax=Rhizobium leguminosarum TaxID=384 RepID=UPI001FDFA905|nr:hypothetical protein [Rhizobium leguminosarum]